MYILHDISRIVNSMIFRVLCTSHCMIFSVLLRLILHVFSCIIYLSKEQIRNKKSGGNKADMTVFTLTATAEKVMDLWILKPGELSFARTLPIR